MIDGVAAGEEAAKGGGKGGGGAMEWDPEKREGKSLTVSRRLKFKR